MAAQSGGEAGIEEVWIWSLMLFLRGIQGVAKLIQRRSHELASRLHIPKTCNSNIDDFDDHRDAIELLGCIFEMAMEIPG